MVLTWSQYSCQDFDGYFVVKSERPMSDFPRYPDARVVKFIRDIATVTWTDPFVRPGHTYYYRIVVWNPRALRHHGHFLPKSDVVSVTIPS